VYSCRTSISFSRPMRLLLKPPDGMFGPTTRDDGPEDLLAHGGGARVDPREDRRPDEVSAEPPMRTAADDRHRALAAGLGEDPRDLLELLRGGERARLRVRLRRAAEQGRVPRHDRRRHGDRLPPVEGHEVGLGGGDALARDLVRPAGEVPVPARMARIRPETSRGSLPESRDSSSARRSASRSIRSARGASAATAGSPSSSALAVEGGARRGHRPLHVLLVGVGHPRRRLGRCTGRSCRRSGRRPAGSSHRRRTGRTGEAPRWPLFRSPSRGGDPGRFPRRRRLSSPRCAGRTGAPSRGARPRPRPRAA